MPHSNVQARERNATVRAKQNVDEASDNVLDFADQTMQQIGSVTANAKKVVDQSLADRPYATLAFAALAGAVVGAIWKR